MALHQILLYLLISSEFWQGVGEFGAYETLVKSGKTPRLYPMSLRF